MKHAAAITLAVSMFLSGSLLAADKPAPAVNADTKDAFDTVASWVRSQMNEGGRYAETKGDERKVVNARLDEMARLFEGKASVAEMTPQEKRTLLVDQKEINSILGKRDGDRLICRSERPIGSNIPVKTCETAREIAARRASDRKQLDRLQIGVQKKQG